MNMSIKKVEPTLSDEYLICPYCDKKDFDAWEFLDDGGQDITLCLN